MRTALASARRVQTTDDPHIGSELGQLHADIALRPVPRLFMPVLTVCGSLTQWWHRTSLAG